MKATAIMKSDLASSPAYSDAVFEIDITVSIMANPYRGETLPFLSMVIVEVGSDAMCYDSPEGIDQDWEIVSAPVMYDPTSLDYEELHSLYLELYAHVLGMYRERRLNSLLHR